MSKKTKKFLLKTIGNVLVNLVCLVLSSIGAVVLTAVMRLKGI